MQAGTWLPLQAMAAWKATGTLHRAPTSTGATVHAEGALAPVVTAIVGVMRGARGPRARLEGRPALERVPASLPAGAVALAPRFAGGLRDGTVADGCRNTCGKEARHQNCTHWVAPHWQNTWLANEPSSAPYRFPITQGKGSVRLANSARRPQTKALELATPPVPCLQ